MIKEFGAVTIRDFALKDINYKVDWINDPINNKYLHYDLPLTYEKTKQWFLKRDKKTRLDCTIEYNHVPVGVIGLLAIDQINKKAEFYITVGNSEVKRQGVATISTKLVLEYAFLELGLNKVYLNVDADNEIACMLYEKIGFVCEGTFHEEMIRNKRFIDRKRYAILKSNYYSGEEKNE